MTREDALRFLEQHQPFPPEDELTQSVIDKFDEVREYFAENPDPRCVPLFLNAFGDGGCYGVYQLVDDTLLEQDRAKVISELTSALQSRHRSVRYWCAQIAASFPNETLVEPLLALLNEDDFDMKYAALTALEQMLTKDAKEAIKTYARREREDELRELAEEIIHSA